MNYDITPLRSASDEKIDFIPEDQQKSMKWDDLLWRHHGTGMLQAYLPDASRLHVWDPAIVNAAVEQSGSNYHNHRYGIHSKVLVGTVANELVSFYLDERGNWELYRCIHFREKVSEKIDAPSLEFFARVDMVQGPILQVLPEGSVYLIPPGAFHRNRVSDFAVTWIRRTELDDRRQALVADIRGMGPRYAFSEDGGFTHSNKPELPARELRGAYEFYIEQARKKLEALDDCPPVIRKLF